MKYKKASLDTCKHTAYLLTLRYVSYVRTYIHVYVYTRNLTLLISHVIYTLHQQVFYPSKHVKLMLPLWTDRESANMTVLISE